jgi:DNA-binding CsgD family transcriptional regulator
MYLWRQLIYNLGLHPPGKRLFALDKMLVEDMETLAKLEQRSTDEVAADLLSSGMTLRFMEEDSWRRWQALSPREQQVTALVCQGYTNPQIAVALVISVDTVKSHVRNVLLKFDLHSKGELRMALVDWDFSSWK